MIFPRKCPGELEGRKRKLSSKLGVFGLGLGIVKKMFAVCPIAWWGLLVLSE